MTFAGLASAATWSGLKSLSQERRYRQRYELRLPVALRRYETDFHGETTNMSAAGISFVAPVKPDIGEQVDFEVRLPEDLGARCEVRLQCKATVVRVERRSEAYEIGVSLIDYDFVRRPAEARCGGSAQAMRVC